MKTFRVLLNFIVSSSVALIFNAYLLAPVNCFIIKCPRAVGARESLLALPVAQSCRNVIRLRSPH